MNQDGESETTVTLTNERWSYILDTIDAYINETEGRRYELLWGGNQLRTAIAQIKAALGAP